MKNRFFAPGRDFITLLLLLFAFLFRAGAQTNDGMATINWNEVHQPIEGFGAASAFEKDSGLTEAQADFFFTTNGIGLTLLRTHIQTDGTTKEASFMKSAQARGAKIWSAPWSPPAAMKSNTNVNNGGFLLTNFYPAYANQLADYVVNLKQQHGINLYAISIQNEPNYKAHYESCIWTGQQLHDFVPYLHDALLQHGVTSTKILLGERGNWDLSMTTNTMNDPVTAAMVGILASHNYGKPGPQPVNAYGKSLWETEACDLKGKSESSITNGLKWAMCLHDFLTVAQVNAWHYWDLNNAISGLGLYHNWVPTKRLYCYGQFSRFIRPGYYRIGVTNSGDASVSAYKDPQSNGFAIVAINTNTAAITESFTLSDAPAITSVMPWITSANLSLANQPAVAVVNQSFTYTLPGQSVVTFAGQEYPPLQIPPTP